MLHETIPIPHRATLALHDFSVLHPAVETFKYPPSVLQALSSHVHEGEDAELSRLMNFQPGPTHSGRQTRWVPYRHSNGLAIYQHQGQGSCRDNEYMVRRVHCCSDWGVVCVLEGGMDAGRQPLRS